jgi:class 3 adenylate cyclase
VPPVTRYAKSGDLSIAYQVVGDGSIDLVFVPGFVSHVELNWDFPVTAGFLEPLSSFTRLIVFDKRGTGLSDRDLGSGSLEQRMDDVRAVMDAAGVERAALMGTSEGGPLSMLFAATYPDRVSHLILYGAFAKAAYADDNPIGFPAAVAETMLDVLRAQWGTGTVLAFFAQHCDRVPDFLERAARLERYACTPGVAAEIMLRNFEIDVRAVLPVISSPTLVLHNVGDPVFTVEHGRFLADHIPGARYVELPGDFHITAETERYRPMLDEIEEFLTGRRHDVSEDAVDRILATVLFTDIVDSTVRAGELGDRRWRDLMDDHDKIVRRELERHRGRMVKSTGDGVLATFDGPARAVRAACALREPLRPLGIHVRAGLHTGEIEVRGDDVSGMAVHIGARVGAKAATDEVLVSRTVVDLVHGSGLDFEERGTHELKGCPGSWELYAVRG